MIFLVSLVVDRLRNWHHIKIHTYFHLFHTEKTRFWKVVLLHHPWCRSRKSYSIALKVQRYPKKISRIFQLTVWSFWAHTLLCQEDNWKSKNHLRTNWGQATVMLRFIHQCFDHDTMKNHPEPDRRDPCNDYLCGDLPFDRLTAVLKFLDDLGNSPKQNIRFERFRGYQKIRFPLADFLY